MLTPLWVEVELSTGVEERMGRRGVAKNGISVPRAEVRKVDSADLTGVSVSPGSLQVERRELEAGEDEEEIGGEDWLDALEELEEEEWVESRALGSSSEDGIHSHVSRSENLE